MFHFVKGKQKKVHRPFFFFVLFPFCAFNVPACWQANTCCSQEPENTVIGDFQRRNENVRKSQGDYRFFKCKNTKIYIFKILQSRNKTLGQIFTTLKSTLLVTFTNYVSGHKPKTKMCLQNG